MSGWCSSKTMTVCGKSMPYMYHTFDAFVCWLCGRNRLNVSFSGIGPPSSASVFALMKSVGKFGGAIVLDTLGMNFLMKA